MKQCASSLALILALCTSPALAQQAAGTPMARIAAGAYPIGSDNGPASARPRHRVQLRAFLIDRYEVSNAQFAAFLNTLDIRFLRDRPDRGSLTRNDVTGADADRLFRNNGPKPAYVEMDDDDAQIVVRGGRLAPAIGADNLPAPESTWKGAVAYCAWRGSRLPTEAEWEAAARGQTDNIYPWGNQAPDPRRAIFARSKGNTAPVDSMPLSASPFGLHHMAGNLAEWTSSLARPYPYRAGDGRENPDDPGERITRGGHHVFDSEISKLRVFFRDGFSRNPRAGHRHIGFRCARDAG